MFSKNIRGKYFDRPIHKRIDLVEVLIFTSIILILISFIMTAMGNSKVSRHRIRIMNTETTTTYSEDHGRMVDRYIYARETFSGRSATFKCNDSMWDGHRNSADLYGSLERDRCYEVTARGVRNPTWSMFPNIIRAEEFDCPETRAAESE